MATIHAAAADISEYAVRTYGGATVKTLADLISFPSVADESMPNKNNPHFKAMTEYLQQTAGELGFEFVDYGDVVVIGLGRSEKRLGLIVHADVQPADSSKWAKSPFTLDTQTEPGLLIGRGTEDDKGPIAAALYAMKALKDRHVPLTRRIELIISYSEESDWNPFISFLAQNPPPDLNVVLDAEFPVVVAEKGWCSFTIALKPPAGRPSEIDAPTLTNFEGGAFLSQVPEDASAVITHADSRLPARLKSGADADKEATFTFQSHGDRLIVRARGVSAHSGSPQDGVNAITHLAELLARETWPPSMAANMARFIHDMVGPGYFAERFGHLAYGDPFMGPLTLSLGVLKERNGALEAEINLRRPLGKTSQEVEKEIRDAISAWQQKSGIELAVNDLFVSDPYDARTAPHVPILMEIFKHETGISDAKPISIGGGSHARLVPNGVCYGPVMPGEPYTGHSEHESISRDRLMLALKIYTAMAERLAGPDAVAGSTHR